MAWFLCPYKRGGGPDLYRYCAMDEFTATILADGGTWSETEILGNHAIVKVRASPATLAAINAAPGFVRLPKDLLDDPLSSLTVAQRNAITTKLEELGYPVAEWRAALGTDIRTKTLRDVLRFAATRRRKPRYDAATDTIVLDGPVQACRPLESVDGAVS